MRAIFLFAVTLLPACTTTANQQPLNTWVGIDEVELVRRWGAPSQVHEKGASKVVLYPNAQLSVPSPQPGESTQ
jgi:hypothetical protein